MTTIDLKAIRSRAEFSTEPFHAEDVAELIAELKKVRKQLTAANHRADGLAADVTSLTRAQTAYAQQVAELQRALDGERKAHAKTRDYIEAVAR